MSFHVARPVNVGFSRSREFTEHQAANVARGADEGGEGESGHFRCRRTTRLTEKDWSTRTIE